MRNLQAELAALDVVDADGTAKTCDPRGTMVGPAELAYRHDVENYPAPRICSQCGYGRADGDKSPCPKCSCGMAEEATALKPRHALPDLLAGHKDEVRPMSLAKAAARATGKPPTSQEYRDVYHRVYYEGHAASRPKPKAKKAKP